MSPDSKWIAWQVKGNDFIKAIDACPYCSKPFEHSAQRDTVLAVSAEYDANVIGHLNTLVAVIERLGKYFAEKTLDNLRKITSAKIELSSFEKNFLSGLKSDLDTLIGRLEALRSISFFSLRDVDRLEDKLSGLKIDLNMIEKLDSAETRATVSPINEQLGALVDQVGSLKGKVNIHKSRIKKAIEANQEGINGFLRSAGYKYQVVITAEPDTYKMKLIHNDLRDHLSAASRHLSYGERNAFALESGPINLLERRRAA